MEVYNNSNQRINLKDYHLYYNNNLDAGDNDVLWASFDKDLYLESGASCMVFWIHNGSNDSLMVDDFNKKFGTNLEEGQNIIILENGGMSNSESRGLRITTNVHDEVNYVTYNVGENDANGSDHADKTITYRYDGTKSVKFQNNARKLYGRHRTACDAYLVNTDYINNELYYAIFLDVLDINERMLMENVIVHVLLAKTIGFVAILGVTMKTE